MDERRERLRSAVRRAYRDADEWAWSNLIAGRRRPEVIIDDPPALKAVTAETYIAVPTDEPMLSAVDQ
jgi:hypothetical protein